MYRLEGKQRVRLLFGGILALLVIFAGAAGFFFWKYLQAKDNTVATSDQQSTEIIESVNKLYKLPTGEEPSVAEVKDKEQLAGREFFKDVENGDYILIYSEAKQAFLYRKSENRLINVAPVNIDGSQDGQAAGASTVEEQQP